MSRLSRRKRSNQDLGISNKTGSISPFEMFDDEIKLIFRVNDAEYDTMLEKATDDEIGILIRDNQTISQKKELLILLDKLFPH